MSRPLTRFRTLPESVIQLHGNTAYGSGKEIQIPGWRLEGLIYIYVIILNVHRVALSLFDTAIKSNPGKTDPVAVGHRQRRYGASLLLNPISSLIVIANIVRMMYHLHLVLRIFSILP